MFGNLRSYVTFFAILTYIGLGIPKIGKKVLVCLSVWTNSVYKIKIKPEKLFAKKKDYPTICRITYIG